MTSAENKDVDYLIFMLSKQLYALPYHNLVQIIDSPTATKLPNRDEEVRGAINFLGELVVLYDLRRSLGLSSLGDEVSNTIETLGHRKQDHINWLSRLKDEIYNDKEISVQTDPHKCAFGKWYDTFQPESRTLAEYMTKFNAPHKHIHDLAVQGQKLIHAGKKQQAKDLIHEAENREFTSLIKLFDGAEKNIRAFTYEYAVVLENSEKKYAISVDSVKSFERFDEISTDIPPILKRTGADFVQAIGRKKINNTTEDVLILDMDRIVVH